MSNKDAFIIYYLNYPKTVELCMTFENIIHTQTNVESRTESSDNFKSSVSSNAGIGSGSLVQAGVSSALEQSFADSESFRVAETYEVKNTKSIYLKKLLRFAHELESPGCIKNCKEGELLLVNDLSLTISEDETTLGLQMLKREALKGMRIDGVDLNNVFSSILEDFSYVLTAETNETFDGEGTIRIGTKIPSENSNEFESKYQMHDLQLGTVSLVGVYKGKVSSDGLNQSTISTAQSLSPASPERPVGHVIRSEDPSDASHTQRQPPSIQNEDIHYLDLIAILQPIRYEKTVDQNKEPGAYQLDESAKAKRGFCRRIKEWAKGVADAITRF